MTEEELQETGVPPPFWAFAWAGGQALSRYLLDEPQTVAGRTVLDLAAGSGLCAIAALKCGAVSALAADIDPFAVAATALNADANDVTVTGLLDDVLAVGPPGVDVILAGDICYEQAMASRMLSWLTDAARAGCNVLIGDPGRRYLPEGLCQLAEYDIPTEPDLEEVEYKISRVYTLEV